LTYEAPRPDPTARKAEQQARRLEQEKQQLIEENAALTSQASTFRQETKATLAATRADLKEAAATIRELKSAAKQSASARERELDHRETLLKRDKSKWAHEKAKVAEEVAEERRYLHSGGRKKAMEVIEDLRRQVVETKTSRDDAFAECEAWEATCAEALAVLNIEDIGASDLFRCIWTRKQMDSWGNVVSKGKERMEDDCVPYPPEIVRLGMVLCSGEAACSTIPLFVRNSLATFFPELRDMSLPTAETCRTWRLGLMALSNLVAGLKMSKSKTLTLHHDGTSKMRRHYGVAVVKTEFGPVMCGGVFIQSDESAKAGAKLVFRAAFEDSQAALDSVREYANSLRRKKPKRHSLRQMNMESIAEGEGDGDDKDSNSDDGGADGPGGDAGDMDGENYANAASVLDNMLPPAEPTLIGRVINGSIALSLMSDHASVAKATNAEIDKLFSEAAQWGGLEFAGTDEFGCGDHKRKGLNSGATTGQQLWLEEVLTGLEKELDEWGETQITTMFYRQLCKELSPTSTCLLGQGAEDFPAWMEMFRHGRYRALQSETGTHYDWNSEVSLTANYLFPDAREYMLYLALAKKDGLHMMERKVLNFVLCDELQSAVKAEAVLWVKLVQPLRMIMNSGDLNFMVLDMNPFYLRTADLLLLWSTEDVLEGGIVDLNILGPSFDAFRACITSGDKKAIFNDMVEDYEIAYASEIAAVNEWESDGGSQWRACFKVMCRHAHIKWCQFAADQLPAGPHAEEAGDYWDPDAETRARVANVDPTNKFAESSFGLFDRNIRRVPNASRATLAALTADKLTKAITWIDANCSKEEADVLFRWARRMGRPIKKRQLLREAGELEAKMEKQVNAMKSAKSKQKELLRGFVLTAELMKTKMAKSGPDMEAKLEEIGTEHTKTKAKVDAQMKYLKLQRRFLGHVGVLRKDMPTLQAPLTTGQKTRRNYTPLEFLKQLTPIVEAVEAKTYDLKPTLPAAFQPQNLRPYRGSTATPKLLDLLAEQRRVLVELKAQVEKEVREDIAAAAGDKRQGSARAEARGGSKASKASKGGKGGKAGKASKVGKIATGAGGDRRLSGTVWVHDIDDEEPDEDEQVWEAKVVGMTDPKDKRIPKGAAGVWYDLQFGRDKKCTFCYEQGQIFTTKKDATFDMYVF
jgi:hypothetical protein